MKKVITFSLIAVMFVLLVTACTSEREEQLQGENRKIQTNDLSYTDFFGKRFAVMVGSVFDRIAEETFNSAENLVYNSIIDEIIAVNIGRADAALMDNVVAMVNLSGGDFPDLETIIVPLEELDFAYSVFSSNQELIDKYNEFLAQINENGIYDEMYNRWFMDFDQSRQIPDIELENRNGVLTAAINASYPPFAFLGANGLWSGFDIEQFYRFAQFLEMDIVFHDMEFGALLPYIVSGRADIASSIYVTEERKQSVIFGDPNYISKTVIVFKTDASDSSTPVSAYEARDYTYFAGRRVGMRAGTIWDGIIEDYIKGTPAFYNDMSAGVEDVRRGRIDGHITDLSTVRVFVAMPDNEDLEYIAVPAEIFSAPMAAVTQLNNHELINRFN